MVEFGGEAPLHDFVFFILQIIFVPFIDISSLLLTGDFAAVDSRLPVGKNNWVDQNNEK